MTKIHPIYERETALITQAFVNILEADSKDRLPAVCCTFFDMKTRMAAAASSKCPKIDADYFAFFLDSFSEDTVDLLCSGLSPGSEKCVKALERIPQNVNGTRTEFTGFVLPLLLVLDSL